MNDTTEQTTVMQCAEALRAPDKINEDQAQELAGFAWARLLEVRARKNVIKPEDGSASKDEAMLSGDPADVNRLHAEHAALSVEDDQLSAMHAHLKNVRSEARKNEACDRVPSHYDDLSDLITELETSREHLADVWRQIDGQYRQLTDDHQRAGSGNAMRPPVELVERMIRAAKADSDPSHNMMRRQGREDVGRLREMIRADDPGSNDTWHQDIPGIGA